MKPATNQKQADRNQPSKEIVRVGEVVTPPAWLTTIDNDDSTKALQPHHVVPRMKIIQGTSASELIDAYGVGALIMTPGNVLILTPDDTQGVNFIPLFFFTSYIRFADMDDTESPKILEQSFDPLSPLAKRCKMGGERSLPYGSKDYMDSCAEVLNFVIVVYDDRSEAFGSIAVLQFLRGEYSAGQRLINAILSRKVSGKNAPLWAGIWNLTTVRREKGPKKKWVGYHIIPAATPYIGEEAAGDIRAMHQSIKEEFAAKLLVIAEEDSIHEEAVEPAEVDDTSEI